MKHDHTNLLPPDVHILIGTDDAWCDQALNTVRTLPISDPHGILRWRLRHGLLRALTPEALEPLLRDWSHALQPPIHHLWVALSGDEWDRRAASAQQWMHEQQLISLISDEFANWRDPVLGAQTVPDASSRLPWLLGGRSFDPVPVNQLRLGALHGQPLAEAQAMFDEGHSVFTKWAHSYVQTHSEDYLNGVYGPFPAELIEDEEVVDDTNIKNTLYPHRSEKVTRLPTDRKAGINPPWDGPLPRFSPHRLAASGTLFAGSFGSRSSQSHQWPSWRIPRRGLIISIEPVSQDGGRLKFITKWLQTNKQQLQLQLMPPLELPRLLTVQQAEIVLPLIRSTEPLHTKRQSVETATAWLKECQLYVRGLADTNGSNGGIELAEPFNEQPRR